MVFVNTRLSDSQRRRANYEGCSQTIEATSAFSYGAAQQPRT